MFFGSQILVFGITLLSQHCNNNEFVFAIQFICVWYSKTFLLNFMIVGLIVTEFKVFIQTNRETESRTKACSFRQAYRC